MGRPAVYVEGKKCPRGHTLNRQTIGVRTHHSRTPSRYCRICHADWHRGRVQRQRLYMACTTQGG